MPRTYAGSSADQRRADRRDRLLAAALALVADDGVAAATVGGVADRAGLAKRYVYESFSGLDELLSAALVMALAPVISTIDDEIARGVDPGGARVVPRVVDAALAIFDHPGAARLYLEATANPGLAQAHDAAIDLFVERLLGALVGPAPHAVADRLAGQFVVAGTTRVMVRWFRGDLEADRAEVRAHLITNARTLATTLTSP